MRRILAPPLLVLGLVVLSACTTTAGPDVATANGTDPEVSASAVDDETANRRYAACMRDHGQDVPDPDPNTPFPPRGPQDDPAWDSAHGICQHLLPGGSSDVDSVLDAQALEQLRQFAVCMREHDVEMSDPEPPGTGTRPGNMTIGGRFANATRAELENDPGFQQAMAACRDKLPTDTKEESTS